MSYHNCCHQVSSAENYKIKVVDTNFESSVAFRIKYGNNLLSGFKIMDFF